MNILIRGDFTARRAFVLNRHRFGWTYQLTVNDNSPNALFVDAINNVNHDMELIFSLVNEAEKKHFNIHQYNQFIKQFNKSILSCKNASLLVLDPFSEMYFALWRHKKENWRFWIPQAWLSSINAFNDLFIYEGKRTFDQALRDTCTVVDHVLQNNPKMPILFIPQPLMPNTELESRSQLNSIGTMLLSLYPNTYVAEQLCAEKISPDSSPSPPNGLDALYYSGPDYYTMIKKCFESGLEFDIRQRASVLSAQNAKAPHSGVHPPDGVHDSVSYTLSLRVKSPTCITSCKKLMTRGLSSLERFAEIISPTCQSLNAVSLDSALIPLDDYEDYSEYLQAVKFLTGGNTNRELKKASALGFFCDTFGYRMHLPDIHEIHTSKDRRCGKPMSPAYLRNVEELGGAPTTQIAFEWPKCPIHYSLYWGVFKTVENYKQGDMVVGRRLYGYIKLNRYDEIALTSMIISHGDYLKLGVMKLVHHHVIKWILARENAYTQGIRLLMYAGIDQGGDGLIQWKKREAYLRGKLHITLNE